MERQKAILGKKGKSRAQAAPPGELIALGKSAAQEKSDIKRSASPQPAARKMMAVGAKRDASALGGTSLLAKKPKMGSHAFTPLGRSTLESERRGSPLPSFSHTQPQLMAFEEAAIDVDPSELITRVLAASKEGDEEKIEKLLCGAVRHLRNNRSKPDSVMYLSLIYLAKTQPSFFLSELAIEAFCSVLKRDVAHNFKSKGNALVSVLACNVLLAAFANEDNWPDNFVKVYIDDLLGERVWVDREDCKGFVDNILTAFGTKPTPRHLLVNTEGGIQSSHLPGGTIDEDDASKSSDGGDSEKSTGSTVPGSDVPVCPRYRYQMMNIQSYVMDVIKDHLAKRQAMDSSCRNLIRLMTVTAGYGEIRAMAGQRLEMWLQNPKLSRTAQDLLMAVCTNCSQENKVDQEVIQQLLKIRLKSKPLVTHYLSGIREMLGQHPDNVQLLVKITLINELTTARNPNNMSLLNISFNHSPETASRVLAEVFQDLLTNKDDYLRALRGLLRETVRYTRLDINFAVFSQALTLERKDSKYSDLEPPLKERYILSVADLISLSMLLSISPTVKEIFTGVNPKVTDREPLYRFRNQLAVIQRDAIYWIHTMVPNMVDIKAPEFVHCLRKVLFIEAQEHYYNKDNWPPENDRNWMMRLATEAPVLEDTLMRVMLMGLTRELPLTANDCMDIVDQLVRRAAILSFDSMEVLQMSSVDLFNAVLNLSTYHYPDNIILPKGYTPPTLAISGQYWKAWIVLLMLSAFNPTTFGKEAWEKYPTLKCLMEMVMTNNYTFPPPTYATDEKMVEDQRSAERQVVEQEVQSILEFESHLAGGTITQQNTHLLRQLTSLDPHGIARTPPQYLLESLQHYNKTYKLGQMLCRSRNPDFLLDVIQKQGTSKSMPWLAELVEASEGSLDVLPVQCLCEFLLHDPRDIVLPDHGDEESNRTERHRHKLKIHKHQQLLRQLQELVQSSPDNTTTMFDVLTYFLQRLASNQATSRQQAIKGLSMVITKPSGMEDEAMEVEGERSLSAKSGDHDWLLKYMPSLPMFPHVKAQMCEALRQACQVETDPLLINSYIIFLSHHAMDQSLSILDYLALDVSQLIVERNSVMNHILPDLPSERGEDYDRSLEAFLRLFYTYLSKARRQEKGEYSWSNTQDQIILQWKTGESATMHILVVHAMVIILSYGLPKDLKAQEQYRDMLEIWFPTDDTMPKAFLLDTSEEALLLPDWLKLRMIRSSEPRLVTAALSELDPRQMLLFVQSFGIPVDSMTQLLKYLDAATESDPATLLQIVQTMNDPSYISRLIHIQRMRGAKGGDKFYELVTEGGSMPSSEKEEKMETEKQPAQTMQFLAQVKPETPINAASLTTDFFKMFSPEIKPLEAIQLLQKLLKVVAKDGTAAASLVQAIVQRVESKEGKDFIQQLIKLPARSSPFIKILLAKHEHLHSPLAPVLKKIMDTAGTNTGSSLAAIIREFWQSHDKQKPLSRKHQASLDLESFRSEGKLHPDTFREGVERMSDKNRLEPLVKQYMQESLQQSTASEGITMACNMLQQSTTQASSVIVGPLLTDWLEMLDPEIVSANVDLQEQLVFGHSAGKENSDSKKKSSTYLLALLTHQSQWSTIRRCLDRILRREKLTMLNPTSVLDFVLACRCSPKIWQGRELKTEQKDGREEVFDFTTEQLLAVVDFIVLEAAEVYDAASAQSLSSNNTPSTASQNATPLSANQNVTKAASHEEKVSSRLDLLLSCICDRDDRIRAILSYVRNRAPLVSREEEQCYNVLLQELYLHFPYILSWLPQGLSTDWIVSDRIHSQLDTVTHRLISVLGKAGTGKAADRMYDANIACRKLAAQHPSLILRQLPLLAAVLGGRTQLTIGEIRHRNILLLFVHVMGLLELLQPHVFHRQHSSLANILQAYFSLFRAHGKEKKTLGSVVYKMVIFLQNFVTYDPQRASSMLQQYVQLLSDLSLVYPDMAELKSLLTGLTLPRQNQSDSADSTSVTDAPEPGTINVKDQYDTLPFTQVEAVLRRMQEGSSDDLQAALYEIDEVSKRRVGILEHFESELKRLMTNLNEHFRTTAFSLIMRCINHSPRKAKDFLPNFLHCLQHSNPDICTTALKNLPEFTVLCQDEASLLLQKVFDVGVKSSVNTSAYITETLHLLNMESILYSKPLATE